MRVLKFIVDGQIIRQDPNCNFEDLVPGTEGYLQCEFSFSPEWDKVVKVAGFWSKDRRNIVECEPQWLEKGRTCMIPAEALKSKRFLIQVLGKHIGTGAIITTNKIEVIQTGGDV